MRIEREPVRNRQGKNNLVAFIPAEDNPEDKLAVIQHGYGGSMDEPHVKAFARAYYQNGYNVLLMDCTNSFNEADGLVEENTAQTHFDDLEDVIGWASMQDWYTEPFALAGHSLGGLSTLIYTQLYPEKVKTLFPAATVVSGDLLEQAFRMNMPEEYEQMKQSGSMEVTCSYKVTDPARRPYSWLQSMQKWNALENAKVLTMPKLIMVGTCDLPTPPQHQKILYQALPAPRDVHLVKGADHCFEGYLDAVEETLGRWIKKND